MRSRRLLAAFIALVAVASITAAAWPRDEKARAIAPVTTTTTSTTTTTVPTPKDFEAADAIVPEVMLYDAPGATDPVDSMTNPTSEHVPLAFLVKSHGPPGWLQVQISRRPNGTIKWIHSTDVSLREVPNRIVIQRDALVLTVYKGTSNEKLFEAATANGAPRTPTPLGDFFVDVVVKISNPRGAYGPYQLSVAGFSDVLQSFGGGVGQIAMHGTNHPELIGQFVSNGCVRLNNDDVTTLATLAPVGTPVSIVE